MVAYYNEINPYAAQWLRNLIAANLIAPGDVDERSIVDVRPDDLKGYTQCHFFAGIGGWSLALRLALWPDDRFVWTGSCPCQPFSNAGKKTAQSDERHLWPHWSRLIGESKPSVVFGEQVASAIAQGWWDDVSADLEEKTYACASAVLPACSVGAPHKRDRLWFVADSGQKRCDIRRHNRKERPILYDFHGNAAQGEQERQGRKRGAGSACPDVADTYENRKLWRFNEETIAARESQIEVGQKMRQRFWSFSGGGSPTLADTTGFGLSGQGKFEQSLHPETHDAKEATQSLDGCFPDFWEIEPNVGRVANGVSGRVAIRRAIGQGEAENEETHWYNRIGTLEGFGNAIVPEVAASFIQAFDEAIA